jgi:hypothetical protein
MLARAEPLGESESKITWGFLPFSLSSSLLLSFGYFPGWTVFYDAFPSLFVCFLFCSFGTLHSAVYMAFLKAGFLFLRSVLVASGVCFSVAMGTPLPSLLGG